jgi:hypothetical protein
MRLGRLVFLVIGSLAAVSVLAPWLYSSSYPIAPPLINLTRTIVVTWRCLIDCVRILITEERQETITLTYQN